MIANKKGIADRKVKVEPKGKYTISEFKEFNLGKVDAIWVVASSSNTLKETNLKKLAKIRIKDRGEPCSSSFNELMQLRQSCWIIEERDRDFFCDCPLE